MNLISILKLAEIYEFKCNASEKYDPPYSMEEIKINYPDKTEFLLKDPVHLWRAKTGLELIHEEPSKKEQIRIWKNWQLMSDKQKIKSDKKSKELFNMTNEEHNKKLMSQ